MADTGAVMPFIRSGTGWGSKREDPIEAILEAERLGYETAWFAETYGSDPFSPLCWAGARTERIKLGTGIVQISARAGLVRDPG
jgi:alkanesulfonate monooxygenase SsuD/methylene tetrahydromethanopterin reductase-like flavin-dependent oxidoreductase (luciferase family)